MKIASGLTAIFFTLFLLISPSFGGVWIRQYAVAGGNAAGSFFVNSTEGYVANNALWKTTRRGTTWEAVPLGIANYVLTGVHYVNSTLYSAGTAVPAAGLIRSTTNNGTTWTQTAPGDILYYDTWFANSSNAVVAGGITGGDFRHTTDGGANWNAINLGGLGGTGTYNAHGTSASNIWVSGSTSVAKWNGTAWSAIVVPGGANLSGIHAEDANNVWVVGNDGTNGCVFKTTDGGTSWTKVAFNTTATIKDIWFINLLEGWAVGNGGVIFHTTNGGGTTAGWTAESAETINNLLSVHFTDANNGWAVGTDGI
ncbi:MAG: YCF48-related protein [Candidatus Margulisbacteria bacterium]|nr:YCF48-related protein [Candidatus Margulisiibacteriota bacterium]